VLRVDFQTHTHHSRPCGWQSPAALVGAARRRGLDGVAVTDHNTTAGVPEVRAAAEELLVVPAEEVDTLDGQVIGLFIEESIQPGMPLAATAEAIQDQGGVVFAPHPFDTLREGIGSDDSAAADQYAAVLDAVEVLNSRCIRSTYNNRARAFAERHSLPGLGGSDAHFAREVGTAFTDVDTNQQTVGAVREALLAGNVIAQGERGSVLNHAGTKAVKLLNGVPGWR
jgi:predicted metal-dependent phosphoesterase TrpH